MSSAPSFTTDNDNNPPPTPHNTTLPKNEKQHPNAIPVNNTSAARGSSSPDGGRSDELLSRNPPSLIPDQGPSEPKSPKHSSWNTMPDNTKNSRVDTDECAVEDDNEDDEKELMTFQRSPPKMTACLSLISLMLANEREKEQPANASHNPSSSSSSSSPSAPTPSPDKKKADHDTRYDESDFNHDPDDVLEMKTSSRRPPIDIKPKGDVSRTSSRPRSREVKCQPIDPYEGKKRDLYTMSYLDYFLEHSPDFHDRGW